jgi:DNA adenine methylase
MMQQLSLLDDGSLTLFEERIPNVAAVPQRSPFRYPGGKTWLVPRIREWLRGVKYRPREFIEPFAGGGIVGLTVAFENLADHVTLVEIDEDVAAVWRTVLGGEAEWLADRIVSFDLSAETVDEALADPAARIPEKAFQTILRNRVNRGGILAAGAGRIKAGENGKGLSSRWYPETLRRRILAIAAIRDRITFIQGDGMRVLAEHEDRADAVFFVDPPYTASGKKAGSRLYTHSELDHPGLFRLCSRLAGEFLMTYDDAEGIRKLSGENSFRVEAILMKNTHHDKKMELLIEKWMKKSDLVIP